MKLTRPLITAIAATLIILAPNARAAGWNWKFDSIDNPSSLLNYCFADPNGWNLVPEHTFFYFVQWFIYPGFSPPFLDDLNNKVFDPKGDYVLHVIDWGKVDDLTGKPIYLSPYEVYIDDSKWEGSGGWGTILVVSTFPDTGTANWYAVPVIAHPPGGQTGHQITPGMDPSGGVSGTGITVIPEPATGLLALAGVALLLRRKRR